MACTSVIFNKLSTEQAKQLMLYTNNSITPIYQLEATEDFAIKNRVIKRGTLGGYTVSPSALENCWIDDKIFITHKSTTIKNSLVASIPSPTPHRVTRIKPYCTITDSRVLLRSGSILTNVAIASSSLNNVNLCASFFRCKNTIIDANTPYTVELIGGGEVNTIDMRNCNLYLDGALEIKTFNQIQLENAHITSNKDIAILSYDRKDFVFYRALEPYPATADDEEYTYIHLYHRPHLHCRALDFPKEFPKTFKDNPILAPRMLSHILAVMEGK